MADPNDEPAPDIAFRGYLEKGELRLQVCRLCSRQIFFPRVLCPHCGADRPEWRPASGRASVYSTTVVRQRPDRGGDYNVALIEFAEGARMMSRVEGIPPAEVRIGMPVQAAIVAGDAGPLVIFWPLEPGA